MSAVQLSEISLAYGQNSVLSEINLSVEDGEYLVVLGESGCGKTSLLRMVAGLVSPTSGRIFLHQRDATRDPPRRRDVALVPQQAGLYPHLTVGQSIAAGIRERCSRAQRNARVKESAELVGLETMLDRRPHQLSGGQLRRGALAKAIATGATVRLLDEPLAAIDARMQFQIEDDLRVLHRRIGGVTLHVTHDGSEAVRLASRIAVIVKGSLAQVATPDYLAANPSSIEVAALIGNSPFEYLLIRRNGDDWETHEGLALPELRQTLSGQPNRGETAYIGYYREDVEPFLESAVQEGCLPLNSRTQMVRANCIRWFPATDR